MALDHDWCLNSLCSRSFTWKTHFIMKVLIWELEPLNRFNLKLYVEMNYFKIRISEICLRRFRICLNSDLNGIATRNLRVISRLWFNLVELKVFTEYMIKTKNLDFQMLKNAFQRRFSFASTWYHKHAMATYLITVNRLHQSIRAYEPKTARLIIGLDEWKVINHSA